MLMNEKLSNYTVQELAEAHIFPHGLTRIEKKEIDEEMRDFRMKLLGKMTEEQKVYAEELRQKYLKEDKR